ncbi:winged helix-turn-helix domain-containing protein [Streptomyces guryensis]|uniref:Winged helix-turn-helix domain-containing protein n=1 Tax=Streptomyces guryensis TaxID=2886947 RepID=A0A9Q3VZ72_9ACTN|nr:winged helix-turn-helix domain-containing protein [Streptomyces guryensis]MCD9880313.1 winged helix-turn-helix domain-containing protein [Streptomyces guryensis]
MSERQGSDVGGREFHRVAQELRARIADGRTYPLRSFLPSQRDLANEFGVSRDTVQRVLRELVDEGLIESRQGSGSRVVRATGPQPSQPGPPRAHPEVVTIGSRLGMAFEEREVTLDVYTLTSESLSAHMRLQAERIAGGEIAPERVALRMLLPSESLVLPYPQVMADREDPRLRGRLHGITREHTAALTRLFRDLETESLVPSVSLEIRRVPLTPTFKLYLLNGVEALHAPYQVIERQIGFEDGTEVAALDVLGLGATLTHHAKDADDPKSGGTVFVDSMQGWFDSVWKHLAE